MKHPSIECQESQKEFLNRCPEEEKEYWTKMFRIGNATYIYHDRTVSFSNKQLKLYYSEWLEGLPENIRVDMETKGFEPCKTMLPFTRYVNEREDIGMDEWMKEHLSTEDYEFYKSSSK